MKFMCKVSRILIVCSLLVMIVTAMNFNTFADEKKWQEAYLEVMDGYTNKSKEYCDCCLVLLDDDDIPEFYIGDPYDQKFGGLYTYSDGKSVKLRDFGFRDFFSAYGEKSGIFRNNYYLEASGSKTGIKFINMDKDTKTDKYILTVLDEFTHDVVNDIYEVNGKVADKETYDKKIAEYTLTDVASDYLTYDEMRKYLLDSIDKENNSSTEAITTPVQTTATTQTSITKTTEITETKSSTAVITSNNTSNNIVVSTSSSNTSSTISNSLNSTTTKITTLSTTVSITTKSISSPKTGISEPVFCEFIIIGLTISVLIIFLVKKNNKSC